MGNLLGAGRGNPPVLPLGGGREGGEEGGVGLLLANSALENCTVWRVWGITPVAPLALPGAEAMRH